jgi:disulfide bond formation protein DsbB
MRPFLGIRKWLLVLAITMTILSMNHVFAQTKWQKYPDNPVLDIGAPGTWESIEVLCPSVIYDGIEYKMDNASVFL